MPQLFHTFCNPSRICWMKLSFCRLHVWFLFSSQSPKHSNPLGYVLSDRHLMYHKWETKLFITEIDTKRGISKWTSRHQPQVMSRSCLSHSGLMEHTNMFPQGRVRAFGLKPLVIGYTTELRIRRCVTKKGILSQEVAVLQRMMQHVQDKSTGEVLSSEKWRKIMRIRPRPCSVLSRNVNLHSVSWLQFHCSEEAPGVKQLVEEDI